MPAESLNPCKTTLITAPTNWQKLAEKTLSNSGWTVHPVKAQLHAWRVDDIKSVTLGLVYAEGIVIRRIWIGKNHSHLSLCVTSHRYYFRENQRSFPLHEREHELLIGRVPPRPNKISILEIVRKGKEDLCAINGFEEIDADPESTTYNALEKSLAVGGDGEIFPLVSDMWRRIVRAGAFRMPSKLNLYVVADTDRPGGALQSADYVRFLEQKWQEVGKGQGNLDVKFFKLSQILARMESSKPPVVTTDSIFLLAVTGRRGEKLPDAQARVMTFFDEIGQAYRLFSYDNKNLRYSASNQLLSMIQSAGGLPYHLKLPFPENFEDGIIVGVDLGHDRDNLCSVAVASAVAPDGAFLCASKVRLPLNEALKGSMVVRLLKSVLKDVEQNYGRNIGKVLIMRDGLVPARKQYSDQESVKDYIDSLDVPTSLIEVRKRGNPLLWQEDGLRILPTVPGTIFAPRGGNVRLLTAYESIEQAGPPRTFKIAIPRGADTFNWGLDAYTAIVCGLCYSPSLGVKPHLPGPIYWADGIAKTSDKDNRFRGQSVRTIN